MMWARRGPAGVASPGLFELGPAALTAHQASLMGPPGPTALAEQLSGPAAQTAHKPRGLWARPGPRARSASELRGVRVLRSSTRTTRSERVERAIHVRTYATRPLLSRGVGSWRT